MDLLRRAGAVVETVSVMGKLQIDGAHGIQVEADELFEEAIFLMTQNFLYFREVCREHCI